MPELGTNQAFKVVAEATYGETVSNPTWVTVGIVNDGNIEGSSKTNNIMGIGSDAPQAKYQGRVENQAQVKLVSPSATIMNQAITRTLGVLGSYNIGVGQNDEAWHGVGMKWNSLAIDIPEEGPIEVTMEAMFKSILEAAVDVGEHTVTGVHLFEKDGLVVSVGTTTYTDGVPTGGTSYVEDDEYVNGSINFTNNLERVYAGSRTPKRCLSDLMEKNPDITSVINTYTPPAFNLEEDCPDDDIALKYVFTDLCDTGGTPTTLTIQLLGGSYNRKNQPVKPNSYVDYTYGLDFTHIIIS